MKDIKFSGLECSSVVGCLSRMHEALGLRPGPKGTNILFSEDSRTALSQLREIMCPGSCCSDGITGTKWHLWKFSAWLHCLNVRKLCPWGPTGQNRVALLQNFCLYQNYGKTHPSEIKPWVTSCLLPSSSVAGDPDSKAKTSIRVSPPCPLASNS